MTVAAATAPLVVSTLDAALEVMRERGLRVSAARRLVLAALFAANRPLSAEQIAGGLGGRLPRSDLASVYRNLETLEQIGIVRHFHVGHGAGHYALACEGEREYAVCEWCGALEALPPPALEAVRDGVRAASGFEARFSHFPIVGLCPSCAARAGGRDGSGGHADRAGARVGPMTAGAGSLGPVDEGGEDHVRA